MFKNQILTSWYHIRRVPFQALSAVFVLSITFFVITMLSVLVYSSGQILKFFETRPQVIAFLKDDATDTQIGSLKDKLSSDEKIKDVKLVTKEEALEIYKKATADNPLLSELVSPAIFPASLEFSLRDLSFADQVISETKSDAIVESVGFTASLGDEDSLNDVINKLKSISWYLKIGGGGFAGLLVGTSFFVLIVIIGMRITTKRSEIETLELIGATASFIRRPIMIEALINYFGDIPILPKDTLMLFKLFGIIFLGEFLMGLILAVSGSTLALSRGKKRK
jgi:cell division transport system permease protein